METVSDGSIVTADRLKNSNTAFRLPSIRLEERLD